MDDTGRDVGVLSTGWSQSDTELVLDLSDMAFDVSVDETVDMSGVEYVEREVY